ncbi:hypothetical protein [Pedobacter sp.]|uniref:hypothetical protein n=1 Tax=Pedobacter sp. TaxID=1411316 RepID=UPI003BA869BF
MRGGTTWQPYPLSTTKEYFRCCRVWAQRSVAKRSKKHQYFPLALGAAVPCSKEGTYEAKRTSKTQEATECIAEALRFKN